MNVFTVSPFNTQIDINTQDEDESITHSDVKTEAKKDNVPELEVSEQQKLENIINECLNAPI